MVVVGCCDNVSGCTMLYDLDLVATHQRQKPVVYCTDTTESWQMICIV